MKKSVEGVTRLASFDMLKMSTVQSKYCSNLQAFQRQDECLSDVVMTTIFHFYEKT